MRFQVFFLALLSLAAVTFGTAAAAPGFELFEHELRDVNLTPVEADIPVLTSASATGKAKPFARVIRRALDFFHRELGWQANYSMVVLDRHDWAKVTDVPYPAPHVFPLNKVVVMPDSLTAYPGFETWGLDDDGLNGVLTVHEIGHALVQANALKWPEMTHTLDELMANVMMAGFIVAEMPELSAVLEGAPEGFAVQGSRALSDLDYIYIGLGLETYAWHQFELARAAGALAGAKPLGQLMPALIKAVGVSNTDLPDTLIDELATVVPAVRGSFSAFAMESGLPLGRLHACVGTGATMGLERSAIIVENRSARVVEARNPAAEDDYLAWLRDNGKTPQTHPDDFALKPDRVEPGQFWKADLGVGQVVMVDGQCLTAERAMTRHVVRN